MTTTDPQDAIVPEPSKEDWDDEIDIVECANHCGELVSLGGFCSIKCHKEYDLEHGADHE